jgi:hypothetical protein
MDPLPEIIDIVRSAIGEGLITSLSVTQFDHAVNNLAGNDLEDYLQELWDYL